VRALDPATEVAAAADAACDKLLEGAPRAWVSAIALLVIVAMVSGFTAWAAGRNFFPVRWYLDASSGTDNTGAAAPSTRGVTVNISGGYGDGEPSFYLLPDRVSVEVGQTVTWVNDGISEVVVAGDGIPASPPLAPGQAYSVTIGRSGEYPYRLRAMAGGEGVRGAIVASY
jgi:plastocyanin